MNKPMWSSDTDWIITEMEKLKKANEIMREALEWIMPKVHQGNHEGDLADCPKATCVEYRKTLQKVDEIMK